MIRGIRTSTFGMYPRQLKQEIAANNLANINTAGFKRDRSYTKANFDRLIKGEPNRVLQELLETDDTRTDYSPGPLEQTGRPLDLGILGDGFFVIQTPRGPAYTRNGNFTMNADNELVNSDGFPVMGENGPIQLEDGEIFVRPDGEVVINDNVTDKIQVIDFLQPYNLKKLGGSLMVPADETETPFPADTENYSVKHSFLERSNVSPIFEMVNMMTFYRNYEADHRAITAQDETLRKAVNEVGKARA